MSKSPIKVFRSGRVAASVWKNEGKYGPFLAVTINRRYGEDGDTKYTSNLNADSLPHAKKVLELAERFIDVFREQNSLDTELDAKDGALDPASEVKPSKAKKQASADTKPVEVEAEDLDSYV